MIHSHFFVYRNQRGSGCGFFGGVGGGESLLFGLFGELGDFVVDVSVLGANFREVQLFVDCLSFVAGFDAFGDVGFATDTKRHVVE